MTSMRLVLATAFFALPCAPAKAHAVIVSSTPQPHQVAPGPDLAIEVRLNSRIDASRSQLTLVKSGGDSVALPLMEASPDALRARATKLAPGAYRLHWQTLSLDGHITQGDIPFEVSR